MPTDTSCQVFRGLSSEALTPGAVHGLVVGQESELRAFSADEAAAELGDPFATEILLKGTFPRFAGEVLDAFATVGTDGDPLRSAKFFLVGDGSQVLFTPETASVDRNMRFLITLGNGSEGPDVMFSSFDPGEGDVELMAWDRGRGGFNYYQTVGDSSGWVFAGNSRDALLADSEDKGPFEAHPSGNVVMKELKTPWINWHSPAASILPSAFAEDDPLRQHPWLELARQEPDGAITAERLIRLAIGRWTRARFAAITADGGRVDRPERIVRQIVTSPAVNLVSSHVESPLVGEDPVDLPPTFFADIDGLVRVGLAAPPEGFGMVSAALYRESMQAFDMRLEDGQGFVQPGDTHFVFVVPERAAEDQAVLDAAIANGLLTDRLAACLLMIDFPNPVFSRRRTSLLRHVPPTATLTAGADVFSRAMAEGILAAAGTDEGSGEREFAERWGAGDGWRAEFDRLLGAYYAAVNEQLATQAGLDDVIRLAESRRDHVRGNDRLARMPISESPLLFARTNVPPAERVMRSDATVAEIA
jgi:hypothetical protein